MRKWGRVAIVAGVAFGLTAGAAAALAATRGALAGNGSYVGGVTFPGPEPLVLWNLPGSGGRAGTCIEANVNGPLHGPYKRQSTVSDPIYAELNHLYANSTSSDVELGELSALNSAKYDGVDKSVQWGYVERGKGGMSQAHATSMLARARALAGPYTVTVTWPASDNRVGVDYRASITVRSTSGSAVPDATVSVVGSGVTLSAATVTTNSSGAASVGFRIGAGTSSTVSISASVSQWTTLDVFRSRGEQAMLVSGAPTSARGVHTAPVSRARAVRLIKVDAADRARTPVAGYRFRITAADGSVVTPSLTSAATPVDVGELLIGHTYTATEIGVPAGASLYIPRSAATTFTVPVGTGIWSLVVADPERPRPSVQTQATPEQALVGQRLSDRVTVTGNDGEDGTITARLYGPVQLPASGRCSDLELVAYQAARSATFSAAVSGETGNATVEVVGPIVERPGCYGWQETLTLSPSGVTVSSAPTAPHESSLVTRPDVRTTSSAQVATPGMRLHDHVTVTGLNGHSASLTAELYGPLPADRTAGCRGLDDAAWRREIARAAASLRVGTVQATVPADGALDTGSVTVVRPGCYTWVETLTPTDGTEPVHTPYGQASETTVVIAPVVTTVVTPSSDASNGSLRDVVQASGTGGTATVLSGSLLGPVAPVGGSCAGLDWAKAPVAGTITALRINHDGRYLTAPVKTAGSGCYTFRETLSTETVPVLTVAMTKPGVPSETVLISRRHIPLAVTGPPLDRWLLGGSGLIGLGLVVLLLARHGRLHGGRHRLAST